MFQILSSENVSFFSFSELKCSVSGAPSMYSMITYSVLAMQRTKNVSQYITHVWLYVSLKHFITYFAEMPWYISPHWDDLAKEMMYKNASKWNDLNEKHHFSSSKYICQIINLYINLYLYVILSNLIDCVLYLFL